VVRDNELLNVAALTTEESHNLQSCSSLKIVNPRTMRQWRYMREWRGVDLNILI